MSGQPDNDLTEVSSGQIERAAALLNQGGVVGIPTDTVYGIAASLDQPAAIERLFDLKGRPTDKPIPVLISSVGSLDQLTVDTTQAISTFLASSWPGGLTVVLPGRAGLPSAVVGPDGTVGLRVPDSPIALAVIDRAGGAIACTSANLAGAPPALSAAEVEAIFGEQLDMVLDGESGLDGNASTVISIANGELRILRQGPVPEARLLAAWNAVLGGRG